MEDPFTTKNLKSRLDRHKEHIKSHYSHLSDVQRELKSCKDKNLCMYLKRELDHHMEVLSHHSKQVGLLRKLTKH